MINRTARRCAFLLAAGILLSAYGAGASTAQIAVDAREAPRGIMSAHLVLPV